MVVEIVAPVASLESRLPTNVATVDSCAATDWPNGIVIEPIGCEVSTTPAGVAFQPCTL